MTDPRPLLLLVLIFFLFFTPDVSTTGPGIQDDRYRDLTSRANGSLLVANASRYGDFSPLEDRWLNLSGFTNETGFGWASLLNFRRGAEDLTRRSLRSAANDKLLGIPTGHQLALYSNVTGTLQGKWVRDDHSSQSTSRSPLNVSAYAPEGPFGLILITGFGRNLSDSNGAISIRMREHDWSARTVHSERPLSITSRYLSARVELDSADAMSSPEEFQLHGIHLLDTGSVLLTTTSRKFAGVYGLPHFTYNPHQFLLAKEVMMKTINSTFASQLQGDYGLGLPFSSGIDGELETNFSLPRCELVVFLQQELVAMPSSIPEAGAFELLESVQKELRIPSGRALPRPAPMVFSMLAFSPDCGYSISSRGPHHSAIEQASYLSGDLAPIEYGRSRRHTSIFILVLICQLWSLFRQMQEASTPSARSRISLWTVSLLVTGDAFTTVSFIITGIVVDGAWALLITACAFVAFVSSAFLGMQLLMDIWTVRRTEQERLLRQQPTVASDEAARALVSTASVSDAAPIIMSSDQEDTLEVDNGRSLLPVTRPIGTTNATPSRRNTFEALVARFYLAVMLVIFFSIWASSWPRLFCRIYFFAISFIYMSMWVPQIYQNAIRNCRRPLRREFVIGQSVLRILPFVYFYGYPKNIVHAEIHLKELYVLVVWVWIQCLLLLSQDLLDPRWFLKSDWMPLAYDYHPLLCHDEEGDNLPIGAAGVAHRAGDLQPVEPDSHQTRPTMVFDCAICMQDLEAPVQSFSTFVDGGLAGPFGMLARRAYMLTPCRHIFHSKCLEGWMKYRLQCPICREDLPPL